LSCGYISEDVFQELFKSERVVNSSGKVIREAAPARYPNWRVVWPNVVGITEPTLDDYFKYGEPVEVDRIGINADYLFSIQKVMEGQHTKNTFYGKNRGFLVEGPSSPFHEGTNERIIGLLMPVHIND
jgi:hypothetical protein